MRTKFPVLFVIALAIAKLMFTLSGAGAAFTGLAVQDTGLTDAVNSTADQRSPETGIEGSASTAEDGDILGLIIGGLTAIKDFFILVTFLPFELVAMGLPAWFAFPIGSLGTMISYIGFFQIVTNRRWI